LFKFCAGEHSFSTSSKGSKAPKSSDLRGQVKFKMLTASEDLVFPENCKVKLCWYKRCIKSNVLLLAQTKRFFKENRRARREFNLKAKFFFIFYFLMRVPFIPAVVSRRANPMEDENLAKCAASADAAVKQRNLIDSRLRPAYCSDGGQQQKMGTTEYVDL